MICTMVLISASILCCNAYSAGTGDEALKRGLEYGRSGDSDKALAEFNKAIELDPTLTEAYYDRAFIYYKQGRIKESTADFNKVLSLDPASADAYYGRALALYKTGSFDAAIADYSKAIDINPDAADAVYGRGLCYFKKNDLKQAINDFNKVIDLKPEFPLAYSARAIAYFSKKDYIKTLSDINKAVALGFRMRPLKEPVAGTIKAPIQETEDLAGAAGSSAGKPHVRRPRKHTAKIKIYVLTALLVLCLAVILRLLTKLRKIRIT